VDGKSTFKKSIINQFSNNTPETDISIHNHYLPDSNLYNISFIYSSKDTSLSNNIYLLQNPEEIKDKNIELYLNTFNQTTKKQNISAFNTYKVALCGVSEDDYLDKLKDNKFISQTEKDTKLTPGEYKNHILQVCINTNKKRIDIGNMKQNLYLYYDWYN
jgi:asparagine N-glycosylation enzyme membrane subunit Stt3